MNRAFNIRRSRAILVAAAFAATLAGCGRRGELEAPPGSTAPPPQQSVIGQTPAQTVDAVRPTTRSNVVPPRQPFILDPIL